MGTIFKYRPIFKYHLDNEISHFNIEETDKT